ncbi:unnamed protein product [Didymodactylos carnosus]|uniref:Polysaccharide lyase 14 domain-containing protein n=1 Tax=Didymodactylos carnosus TaxID=1234261 RepID=A0A815ECZ9_9BILA|nr:unnamed protein product [Didymodactylos carnosus]CAF1309721.1 unnamed protein product [Didymodactylos carnosus]CAF3815507.1 unnamed protein product [Didymodactylos carnosus]CAF4145973.1 unnamed protein product [Didymodactylos carnosus]
MRVLLLLVFLSDYTVDGLYQKSLNWNNHPNGEYKDSTAKSDFGNIRGWKNNRAYISGGSPRITLEKNALSGACGMIANMDLPSGTAYELDFDLKFHSQFDWSRGGKVGFGFGLGNGNTGCNPATDGNGGSLRIMWYNDNSNRVYLKPYVYYKDMPTNCGDDFGVSYPSSGSLRKGAWYKIHLYVKSNTGSDKNGHVQVKINGAAVLDRAIRWTTNDSKRQINRLMFHSFRGGSQTYWQSTTDGYIYYDNLQIKQIA